MKSKYFFLALLMMIFIVPHVSAFEFDNVKDYDSVKKEVTFKNSLLGFPTTSIGTAQLNTPHFNKVGLGYNEVAAITICSVGKYEDVLKAIDFYNKSETDWQNHPINKSYDLKLKKISYKDVTIKGEECEDKYNESCVDKQDETFKQKIVEYEKVDKINFDKEGCQTFSIFTDVKAGEYIEFIPQVYGLKIEEWASWSADLNTNLIIYYKMDELSGAVVDALGNNNATNNGATPGVTGIINTAYQLDNTDSIVSDSATGISGTAARSFSLWVDPITAQDLEFFIQQGNNAAAQGFGLFIFPTTHVLTFWGAAADYQTNYTVQNNSFQHFVVTYNGTEIRVYANGQIVLEQVRALNTGNTPLRFGVDGGLNPTLDGVVDEVGVWTRALNLSEVQDLYNGGNGITVNQTDDAPFISFNSPESTNYTTTPQTITFNFTAYDAVNLTEVNLYVNGVLNQTNASGVNNSDYIFNLTVGEGTFEVYATAVNYNSLTNTTETRTFIIDATAPIVNITSPSDPYTVTQFNESVQINWSVLDDNPDTCWYIFPVPLCYQESVDVSNQTGIDGVCNQNYNGTVSLNVPGDFYIYEDYEKPSTDIVGAIWKVKHGALDTYNVTIPESCFNYNSTHLNFRIRAVESLTGVSTSFGQCYNGSWQTITQTSTGSGAACTIAGSLSRMNDGDYDTGYMYTDLIGNSIGCGRQGTWYDDAIFWEDVSTPTEIISCDLNTTTINYPTSNPDTETFYLFANDTFGRKANDSLLLVKSTAEPNITIDSPITLYDTLENGQSIDLNFSFENNTVLDSCWYNYNNVNYTLNCTENTSFSYVFRYDNVTLYVNDTLGNINQSTKSFSAKVYFIDFVYENETVEGSLEDYYVNITLGDAYSFDNATLYYDGVGSVANSLISSGQNNYIGVVNLEVPNVDNATNLSFLWNIGLTDGSSINSSLLNQTVNPLNIDNCSTYNFTILNISLFTERDKLPLNGTIEVYLTLLNVPSYNTIGNVTGLFENVQNVAVCSENNLSTSSVAYSAEIRYYSTEFATELYNIQRRTVQPIADDVELYDLNSTFSTEFKVTYQDSTFTFVQGAIIQLQRKYVSEGIYRTVEAPITSSEGFTVVHIDLDTVPYRATVVKNGVVLDEFENLVFKCQSELTGECEYKLLGAIDPDNIQDYDNETDFSYSEPVLANGTVTVSFTVPTGVPSIINVVLEQKDQFGNTTLCNRTVTTSGGSVSCNYSETLGDSYIDFYISKDGVPVAVKSYVVVSESDLDWLDNNFIFILVLLFSLVGLALTSPEWVVINGIVSMIIAGGLFMANGLNFVTGLGFLAWLVIAVIIIISKMSKQEDR